MGGVSLLIFAKECDKTLLMMIQHWCMEWLGGVSGQAITWDKVNPDLCHHTSSLGGNELT